MSNDMSENKHFVGVLSRAATMVRSITESAMVVSGVDYVGNMMIATATSAATLTTLAEMVSKDIPGTVDDNTMLFAALLVIAVTSPQAIAKGNKESAFFGFDILSIADAMDTFERYTGRKPDAFLLPAMAAAARQARVDNSKPLEELLASRRGAK